MPGRTFTVDGYRFGFGGQEKENEIINGSNWIAYVERLYDPRIGRWISLDGAADLYPSVSPYTYVANSPNLLLEKDGHIFGTIIGAVIGGVKSAKSGKSVWKGMLKGGAAGAAADLAAAVIIASGGTALPVVIAAGAGAGLSGNLTEQLLDDRPGVDGFELGTSTVIGGVLGFAGTKVAPLLTKLFRGKGKIPGGSVEVEYPTASFIDDVASPQLPKVESEVVESTVQTTVVDLAKQVTKKGSTVANRLGQQMHRDYKIGEVLDGVRMKEFRLPSGKRIDFIDFEKRIIYELKPNNRRAIKLGEKQLEMYKQEV